MQKLIKEKINEKEKTKRGWEEKMENHWEEEGNGQAPNIDEIESFIRQLLAEAELKTRLAVLEEIEKMMKEMKLVVNYKIHVDPMRTHETTIIGNNPKFTPQPLLIELYPYEYGYNQALSDLLSKIKEMETKL